MPLKTKEEKACDALREFILSGAVPTGEFFSQRRLADRIGAAVVTVRAALRQLENEGLVESIPKWGVRIPQETRASLQDRYYLREVFEVEAVGQIVSRRDVIDKETLRRLAIQCDELVGDSADIPTDFGTAHVTGRAT